MDSAPTFTPETLLRHEPFVRAVVRGLLNDDARVSDVLQETWLRALRRPPRFAGSLRAWLARIATNLARDEQRSAGRRSARERAAARDEALESVDVTHGRLAAQREVVDAVLALEEPYRTVVLLRYYQDQSPTEIAARLGRSPATVRSQLSRAHTLLRGTLDSRFDGGRSTWAGLLLPALGTPDSVGLLGGATAWVKGLAALLLAAAVTLAVVPRFMGGAPLQSAVTPMLALPAALPPTAKSTALELAVASPEPEPAARQPIEIVQAHEAPPTSAELGVLTTRDLFDLAVQTQRALEKELLTPSPDILSEHAAFLARPDTGIARILNGSSGNGSDPEGWIQVRGGGSYFSFSTRDHSYDAEPDISLRGGLFSSGFYGHYIGMLLPLGNVALDAVPASALPVPGWLPADDVQAWSVLWSGIRPADAVHASDFRVRNEPLWRRDVAASTDQTVLLRVYSPDEHDTLVVFRALELDSEGCTLAWRTLQRWPVPGTWRGPVGNTDEHPQVPAGPAWLDQLSVDELRTLLVSLRTQAHPALFDVPQPLRERYLSIVEQDGASFAATGGFARILHRGQWDALVEVREGGAYYSFQTGSNAYDGKSELGLEQESFSSGFAGHDEGLLLDLGEIPFDQLAAVMSGGAPVGLSAREREAWDFLWSVRATVEDPDSPGRRVLPKSAGKRAAELGLTQRVPALVGHTYMLRAVLYSDFDHLVVFTVIGGDAFGHTLAWRSLRTWPVEQESRAR